MDSNLLGNVVSHSIHFNAFSLVYVRCTWMFPMPQTLRLSFQWSLSQQVSTAFQSKTKRTPAPIRTHLNQYRQVPHCNQHLFASPMFLLLLPLDQPIPRNHHLLIQISFQTWMHQDSTHRHYLLVLHHTALWILHLLLTTRHQSAQLPRYTSKVQHMQSLILQTRLQSELHSPPSPFSRQYKMILNPF